MITRADIASWSISHPWNSAHQVEQDLLLSQAICAIGNDDYLGEELVFRGGTALHKLFLPHPYRYSEDLDYVRTTGGGIGEVSRRLTDLGKFLGYSVRTEMGKFPKVFWRFLFEDGAAGKIKIEINTFERHSAFPLQCKELAVSNPYYQGMAKVQTYQAEELIASKLRALYQRTKGRDLFDIWLALTVLHLDAEQIMEAFKQYTPKGLTGKMIRQNIVNKLEDDYFCTDMDLLLRDSYLTYNPYESAQLVMDVLVSKLN